MSRCKEINSGLRKLDLHPPIYLSPEDYEAITDGLRNEVSLRL